MIAKLPTFPQYLESLPQFNFTDFARRHAREHLEVCVRVLSDNVKSPEQWSLLTQKAYEAARDLEPTLEEEQLLFFPYWVNVCVEHIPEEWVPRVVDLLVGPFTRLDSR